MSALGAHHFLQGLTDLGISYVFANLGTDHVSLIEELARWDAQGRAHPQFILCPHENVAIHMAAGYAAVTGQGQAVMVHVDAGTANAVMGMHNMLRARLPVMLLAGKAPYTLRGELPGSRDNYVHFVQDPFDIASLVRPYVKWDYNLPTAVVAREALRRAHSVMHTDPQGPVYMTLPREVLAEEVSATDQAFDAQRYGPALLGGIDEARVLQIADRLLAAERPVVITSYLGRKAEAVAALEELAQLCGMPVVDYMASTMSISRQSPCFAGFDPAQVLPGADVGLLLDIDVPWLPKFVQPEVQTWWAHVDVDPIKQDYPMWGFATDLRVQADAGMVLRQVAAMVRERANAGFHERAARRMQALRAASAQRQAAWAQVAARPGQVDAIAPAWICAALGRALAPQDIVINEAVRNSPAVMQQIPAGWVTAAAWRWVPSWRAPKPVWCTLWATVAFTFARPARFTPRRSAAPCPSSPWCWTTVAGRRSRRRSCGSTPTAQPPRLTNTSRACRARRVNSKWSDRRLVPTANACAIRPRPMRPLPAACRLCRRAARRFSMCRWACSD
jgi:acetolactate synthase-1/2/3 large subunit